MKYFELEPEQNTFDLLVADITHKCNMECANCYIPNRDVPDMDEKKLYDFLRKLPNRIVLRLIGAEPTMRNDLPDMIREVRKCGHNVSLTTNGLKLSSKKYVQSLKDASLRMVLISMNGADDPEVYKVMDDGGEYSKMKVRALENCMNMNMIVNTGTIIAKGTNESTIRRQIEVVKECVARTNYKSRLKPLLRMKSVGSIGRYMENSAYSIQELEDLFLDQCPEFHEDTQYPPNAATFSRLYTDGEVYVRLIDWSIDEEGVPDSGNETRGRITPDFKVAPFFEHVKMNEGGY